VQTGRYRSDDEVILDALKRHKQQQQQPANQTPSEEAFLKQLVELGLMSQLPDTIADLDDPTDQPIRIAGEPISETIIRDRR
jgi:Arc/MetJ-type ribon-helix-helix transcriptional regulator